MLLHTLFPLYLKIAKRQTTKTKKEVITMSQHPLPHLLCPHSQYNRNGMEVSLTCNFSNIPQFPCCFTRYCTTDRTLKMIPAYQEKCKFTSPKDGEITMSKKKRNDELDNEIETNETNNIIEIETDETSDAIEQIEEMYSIPETLEKTRKTEMCRILYVKPNILAFDFKGYGIHISTDHVLDQEIIPKKFIEVEYESDIGKPDFKYFVKFQ